MVKKLFFILILGALGYVLFMQDVVDQTKSQLEEGGADASVLQLLDSDQN